MMKEGVRYIAIASGPIKNRYIGKRKDTLIIGIIFRENYIEGFLSTKITSNGTDSTRRIIEMVNNSRFKEQIRILIFNGIAIAGLNIINPKILEEKLDSKVVLLNRRKQNANELINALSHFSKANKVNVRDQIEIVKESSNIKPLRTDGFFIQSGLDNNYIKNFTANAFEALRIAHIVARGIATGESKGRL